MFNTNQIMETPERCCLCKLLSHKYTVRCVTAYWKKMGFYHLISALTFFRMRKKTSHGSIQIFWLILVFQFCVWDTPKCPLKKT